MQTHSRSLVLALLVGAAALLGGGLWLLGSEPGASEDDSARSAIAAPRADRAPAPAPPAQETVLVRETEVVESRAPKAPFPLEVELELLWARPAGTHEGVRPWGSGRSAVLEGQFADAMGRGVEATITFEAGPNEGRSTRCNPDGTYRMEGLSPGLSIVRISGPAIIGSRRDVRLGSGQVQVLNGGFGRLASVSGRVTDRLEAPIAGARVDFDGQIGFTDEEGYFQFAQVASGPALVEIHAKGYAARLEKVNITAGAHVTGDRLQFALEEGCSLVVAARESPGSAEPVRVFLFPSRPDALGGFPWHRLNPIELPAGTTRRIDDLPGVPVHVRAFHRGAAAATRLVSLRKGREASAILDFEAGSRISGVVMDGDLPAPGVTVRLEAPDRDRATLAYFRLPSGVLSNQVLPTLPPAYQEARTDAQGRFLFTAFPGGAERYYLEARGTDGSTWAGRVVGPAETDLVLSLQSLDGGGAWLRLPLGSRALALEADVTISGREKATPHLVPPGEDLLIEGLRPGHWRLVVSWRGGELTRIERLEIEGGERVPIALPPELSGTVEAAAGG